jgi:hypothetical protein
MEGLHIEIYRLMGGGFMKHVNKMGSGAVIYIPSFIEIGPGIQRFTGRDKQKNV